MGAPTGKKRFGTALAIPELTTRKQAEEELARLIDIYKTGTILFVNSQHQKEIA